MVTSRDRRMDLDWILFLSPAKDSDHDTGELRGCGQEVEAACSTGADFDAPTRGQVARSSRHEWISQEWWRRGRRDSTGTTRHGITVTDRREPVFGRCAAPDPSPCGRPPTSPYIGRKSAFLSASDDGGQRGWPIASTAGTRLGGELHGVIEMTWGGTLTEES